MQKNLLDDHVTNCHNCGAPLPPLSFGSCTCRYCGTTYTRSIDRVIVVHDRPGVIPLGIQVRAPEYSLREDPERVMECVRAEIARRLAAAIVDKISIEEDFDIREMERVYRGRIRILDDGFQF